MDYADSRGELEVDLESGGNTSEEDRKEDLIAGGKRKDKVSERVWSAVLNYSKSEKSVYDETIHRNSMTFWDDVDRNVELSMCKNSDSDESMNYMALVAKKHAKDKCKKINPRNPTKPPRPPKGPSLDAADRKLIREMAELAVRKRARVERMKTLKKVKSSNALPTSSLSGMVVTLLFCLVLIYQGLSSRSSVGKPPAAEDFISVQIYRNFSSRENTTPASTSQNSVEDRVSDLKGGVDGTAR